jgi:hypothetical protein
LDIFLGRLMVRLGYVAQSDFCGAVVMWHQCTKPLFKQDEILVTWLFIEFRLAATQDSRKIYLLFKFVIGPAFNLSNTSLFRGRNLGSTIDHALEDVATEILNAEGGIGSYFYKPAEVCTNFCTVT